MGVQSFEDESVKERSIPNATETKRYNILIWGLPNKPTEGSRADHPAAMRGTHNKRVIHFIHVSVWVGAAEGHAPLHGLLALVSTSTRMSEWRNTELASGSPVVRQTSTASDAGHKSFTCSTSTTTNYSYGFYCDDRSLSHGATPNSAAR